MHPLHNTLLASLMIAPKGTAAFVARPLAPQRTTRSSFTTQEESSSSHRSTSTLAALPEWKIFVDLQCPFAKKTWEQYPSLQEKFGDSYQMSMHLTSLAFHPQAFVGQQAAYLIGCQLGADAKQAFVDASFSNQARYKRNALGDYTKLQVDNIFADIAEESGAFDDSQQDDPPSKLTRAYFLEHLHDWEEVIKPTYGEVKVALNYGVNGTPKHVIDDKLVLDTESTWGPAEWENKLRTLKEQGE